MRLRYNGNTVHLGYCSNVHPAGSVDELVAGLSQYALGVRRELGVGLLSVTLWIPASVAHVLDSDRASCARWWSFCVVMGWKW